MVKKNHILIAFLKLVRWPNLIMVILTMIAMRQCIISPMLKNNGLSFQLSSTDFILLIIATVFITAGGYVINDYFDRKTDFINRPDKVILSRKISQRWGMLFHSLLTGIGIIAGFFIAFKNNIRPYSLIFVLVSGLLWFYSTTYKRQFLIGNIIVSLLTALVPLIVLIFELPLLSREYGPVADAMGLYSAKMIKWILYFTFFAFILNLIREIIKDAEDIDGDRSGNMQTLPIIGGLKITKIVSVTLLIISVIVMIYFNIILKAPPFALIYISIFVIFPELYVFYFLIKASNKNHFHKISILLKIIMVTGILYSVLIRFFIINP